MSVVAPPRVACVGVFIVDTLGRPVTGMPAGQRGMLIDEIALTPAGSAGGTAVDLAHLGADVLAVGAVGDDDLGEYLRGALAAEGVDPGHLVVKPGVQTSASILVIAPDGSRPAWHVPGANAELNLADVPWDELLACEAVHVGGASAMPGFDGEATAEVLRRAREAGALTTLDCLGAKREDMLEMLAPSLPNVDVFFPNDDELAQITGLEDRREGARMLRDRGAGAIVVTCGAEGALVFGPKGEFHIPALESEVVDSTGCGDALVAGTTIGLLRGWSLCRSVELGTAAASLTLSALGSIAGLKSSDQAVAHMERNLRTEAKG